MEFAFGPAPTPRDLRAASGGEGFGQNLGERVRIYETLQNVALEAETLVVVVDPAVGARAIADLVDLPRLKIRVAARRDSSAALRASLERLGVLGQIDFIDGAPTAPFEFLLADAQTIARLHRPPHTNGITGRTFRWSFPHWKLAQIPTSS
jgi:hypothetical protein